MKINRSRTFVDFKIPVLFQGVTLQIKESYNQNETAVEPTVNVTDDIISESSSVATFLSILPISKF